MDKLEIVQQNLKIAQDFRPMQEQEMRALRDRCRQYAGDGRFELYKTSIKYDNPEARMAHDFPLDDQSKEAKEMMMSTKNTGDAFPKLPQEEK